MVFSVQRSKTGGPQDFLLQYSISIPKTISQPHYNSKCKWIAPHNTGFTNNLKKTNTTTSPALVTHKLKSLIKLIYLYPANSWYEITDSHLPLKSSKKTQFLSNRRHYNHFVPPKEEWKTSLSYQPISGTFNKRAFSICGHLHHVNWNSSPERVTRIDHVQQS